MDPDEIFLSEELEELVAKNRNILNTSNKGNDYGKITTLTEGLAIEWIHQLQRRLYCSLPDFAAYEKIEEEALLAILDFEIPEEL